MFFIYIYMYMMEELSIRNHSNAILGVSVPIIFLFIFDFDDVTIASLYYMLSNLLWPNPPHLMVNIFSYKAHFLQIHSHFTSMQWLKCAEY